MKNNSRLQKLLALLLAVLMLALSFTGCEKEAVDTEKPDDDNEITPLFWHVTSDDSDGELWLLGTIHAGRKDIYPFPDEISDALDGCDYLAVEYDIVEANSDISATTELLKTLVYTDGTTISDHISPELYEEAVAVLEEAGVYNEYFDYMMASYWDLLIESLPILNADFDNGYSIDEYLLKQAKKADKDIIEIESDKEQYIMFSKFSDGLAALLLESAVNGYNTGSATDNLEKLFDAWCSGDEDEIIELSESDETVFSEEEIEYYNEFNYAFFTSRNVKMTEAAVDYLNNDMTVFYAVGTAHMVGEDGIVESLRDLGYNVEAVSYN